MEVLSLILAGLDPTISLASVISGLLVGFFSRNIKLDRNYKILFGLFLLPWFISRLVLVISFLLGLPPATFATGIVGTILFGLYLTGIYLGRRLGV